VLTAAGDVFTLDDDRLPPKRVVVKHPNDTASGANIRAMMLVQERDVRTPWDDLGAEYRGIRPDGKHRRAVYLCGQSISYDHSDVIAAKYFDGIIDSLCFKWS